MECAHPYREAPAQIDSTRWMTAVLAHLFIVEQLSDRRNDPLSTKGIGKIAGLLTFNLISVGGRLVSLVGDRGAATIVVDLPSVEAAEGTMSEFFGVGANVPGLDGHKPRRCEFALIAASLGVCYTWGRQGARITLKLWRQGDPKTDA